jgi:hypothetical protein
MCVLAGSISSIFLYKKSSRQVLHSCKHIFISGHYSGQNWIFNANQCVFFSSADNKYHERTPISRTSRRLNGARLLAVSCTGQPALVEEFSGLTWLVLVGRKDKLLALIEDGNG